MLTSCKINYFIAIICSIIINGFAVFYLDIRHDNTNWVLGLSQSNPQQLKELLQNLSITSSVSSSNSSLNKKTYKHHLQKHRHVLPRKSTVEIKRQPRLRQAPPKLLYPASAVKNNQEGKVKIAATISASGTPESIRVVRSSGFASLDRAAIDWFKKLKFIPAKQKDIKNATNIVQTVSFQIQGHSS